MAGAPFRTLENELSVVGVIVFPEAAEAEVLLLFMIARSAAVPGEGGKGTDPPTRGVRPVPGVKPVLGVSPVRGVKPVRNDIGSKAKGG